MDIMERADYALAVLIVFTYAATVWVPDATPILWVVVFIGATPTLWGAVRSSLEGKISIDTFNIFAIAASFAYGDVRSSAFIVLMLTFARLLNYYTESRTRRTLEELMKLKPQTALLEKDGGMSEIPADSVSVGGILLVKDGARVPVDGTIIFGSALINESSVTGESLPVQKGLGDSVLSSTLNESGVIKVRAKRVGKDSTIERVALLVAEAAKNKSRSEKLADRFASIYLPVVLAFGAGAYLATGDIRMTAAIFLVACADDMAVAIPLAMTAALGRAAKRGVVIKGGEYIESLSKIKKLVVDKTGTLTYGAVVFKEARIEEGVDENDFWKAVAVAEKFSEHPIGRIIFKEAMKRVVSAPDPEEFRVFKGSGILAVWQKSAIAIGDYSIIPDLDLKMAESDKNRIKTEIEKSEYSSVVILRNGMILGFITIGDLPRSDAGPSIEKLRQLGINDIRMFTGDNEISAKRVGGAIGIDTIRSTMTPEEKLKEIEELTSADGGVAMVGDGVNDAAALARADVGIAMGYGGMAVAVEAADVVVLNDDLSRLPEMIVFSREVMSVIRWDMIIWWISNIVGFALVLTGVVGPAMAAFYNFISDFIPLLNSARLFGHGK